MTGNTPINWRKPSYPGDYTRIKAFQKGHEVGDIRIKWLKDGHYEVCAYLPGIDLLSVPGDTPKVWPNFSQEAFSINTAEAHFDAFCRKAVAEGWGSYCPL